MSVGRRLLIIGCGGFGREVFVLVQALCEAGQPWEVEGFVDDDPSDRDLGRIKALGSRHVGTVVDLSRRTVEFNAVVAIGSSAARVSVVDTLASAPVRYPVLVHPACTIGLDVRLAPGSVVAAGARLSTNISVGPHTHVDQNATVGHDSVISAFARLNPQACVSGSVTVGERSTVGAAATILPGLSVGNDCLVGAAACVVRSVAAGETVKGVPAR